MTLARESGVSPALAGQKPGIQGDARTEEGTAKPRAALGVEAGN